MLLNRKRVLITGASGGIGAALAKQAANAGASVVLLARRKPELDRISEEIVARGGQARAYAVDLTDAAALTPIATDIILHVGAPDILINNAGAGLWRFTQETTPAEAIQFMAVPYFAAFNVVHAFLPAMRQRNSGHIVNVSSVGSRFVWPGATAYLAARWAFRGFTEALRADLNDSGIRVTLCETGVVTSTYWEHNPGSRERVPWIARFIPELSPEQAAQAIIRGIERERQTIVAPFAMKLFCHAHSLCPRFVQWLVIKTGYRGSGVNITIETIIREEVDEEK